MFKCSICQQEAARNFLAVNCCRQHYFHYKCIYAKREYRCYSCNSEFELNSWWHQGILSRLGYYTQPRLRLKINPGCICRISV